MVRKQLPAQVLQASPVDPDSVAIWFRDLQRGLNGLFDAVDKAIRAGESLSGFEHLNFEEAYSRILKHLEESEMAAVFQLLACAEAQLHKCEEDAGHFIKKVASRRFKKGTSGLDGVIGRIKGVADSSADLQPLEGISLWSPWRDWYAHGRRFQAAPPPAQVHFGSVVSTVQAAISNAIAILAIKGAAIAKQKSAWR